MKTRVGHGNYEAKDTVFKKTDINSSKKDAAQHMNQIAVNKVEEFEKTVTITIHNDIYTAS